MQPPMKYLVMSTANTTRKIYADLARLEKSSNLTSEGKAWLIAAADPFHDSDIQIAGYPDLLTSATVVQLVKKQIQITVPSSVTSGSNWDCSVVMFPNLCEQVMNDVTVVSDVGAFTTASTTNPFQIGGLSYTAGPQGDQLWPVDNTGIVSAVQYGGVAAASYVKGNCRLIAGGFEVVNTTADIYKQGQVTAWRMPNSYTEQNLYTTIATTPTVTPNYTTLAQRLPPGTLANAQLLFGSRSWAAREGAYVVLRQNSANNPANLPRIANLVCCTSDFASGFAENVYSTSLIPTPNCVSDVYAPYDLSGCHFSGLSYQTTLTVNIRWFIERIPNPSESDLVVLATPSSPYDSLALELYLRCMADMPPGVMLSENPFGEWFASALEKVAEWAPKIGNVLGMAIPGAAGVGTMAGTLAQEARKFMPQQTQRQLAPPLPSSASDQATAGRSRKRAGTTLRGRRVRQRKAAPR